MRQQTESTEDLCPDKASWSVSHVISWLRAVLHEKYPDDRFDELSDRFARHKIDGSVLVELSAKEWKEAVPLIGPRKVLLRHFLQLEGTALPGSRSHSQDFGVAQPKKGKHRVQSRVQATHAMMSANRSQATTVALIPSEAPGPAHRGDAEERPPEPATGPRPGEAAGTDTLVFKPSLRGPGPMSMPSFGAGSPAPQPLLSGGTWQPPSTHGQFARLLRRRLSSKMYDPEAEQTPSGVPAAEAPPPPAPVPTSPNYTPPRVYFAGEDPPADAVPPPPPPPAPPVANPPGTLPDDAPSPGSSSRGLLSTSASTLQQSAPLKLASFLETKRPGEAKECVMMMPDTARPGANAAPNTPQSFAALQDDGAGMRLFGRSAFCNLPVVDCGYLPDKWAQLPWHQRLLFKVRRSWCKALFFLDTLFRRMLSGQDLLFSIGVVLFTWQCVQQGWTFNVQPTLLLNILLFPLSFAVNAAYQRREAALQHFGTFKACTLNVYLLHRCYQFEDQLPEDFLECSRSLIHTVYGSARSYFVSLSEPEKLNQLKTFYDTVAEIAVVNDVLRLSGVPPPLVACAIRDLRDSLGAFEHLRCFSDYRTPSGIRAFTRLLQCSIPLLLSPYFAHLTLQVGGHQFLAPLFAGFICLPFLLLNNLQLSLENPFAGDVPDDPDADDIRLDELQVMTYMAQDADTALKMQAEFQRCRPFEEDDQAMSGEEDPRAPESPEASARGPETGLGRPQASWV